jgi:hypothetical protein
VWACDEILTSNVDVFRHLPRTSYFTGQFIITVGLTSLIMSESHNMAENMLKVTINTNNQTLHCKHTCNNKEYAIGILLMAIKNSPCVIVPLSLNNTV